MVHGTVFRIAFVHSLLFLPIIAASDPDTFSPGGESLDPAMFSSWLNDRAAAGSSRLRVARGRYTVTPAPDLCGRHLCISSVGQPLKDVVLDFSEVTLVFAELDVGGVLVEACQRCVIQGLTTQYATHPTNQATITGLSDDERTIYVEVDKGYPLEDWINSAKFPCNVFGKASRNFKPGTGDLTHTSIEHRGNRSFAMMFSRAVGPSAGENVGVGDGLGCRATRTAFAFQVHGCSASIFQDITLLGSSSFAFFQTHPWNLPDSDGGNHFNRLKILRPPKPEGAIHEPLLAAGADGFHNAGVPHGPIIENCHFERMTDDGIAIHGSYAVVVEANATSLVVQARLLAGTTLRLYNDAFQPAGRLQVSKVRELPNDYRPPGGQNRSHTMPGHFAFAGPYSLLTMSPDSIMPDNAGFDFIVSNEGRSGNLFVIRNNTIIDHRARGMLIKASHGLVEDNVINGSTLGGIIVTPELYWGEADFTTNLTVRRNQIARVGIGKQSYGALALGAKAPANSGGVEAFVAGYGHKDVSITDNELSDLDTTAIWVTSARNVTLARNSIKRQWLEPTWATCCPPLPFPASTVVWLSESSQVVVRDNCVKELGPYAETLYNYTDTVVESDLDNGVRLCGDRFEVAV